MMTEVKGYVAVFGGLLALTVTTVVVSRLSLPVGPGVAIGLTIAALKAALVVMFFMHLKTERPMVLWPLALTAVLFAALFAFVLWSESDHVFLTSSREQPTLGPPRGAAT
jgi:cytochrome c oxidase subunit 4